MTPTTEELRALLDRYNLPTDCDCDNEDCVKCAHYPTFQEAAAKQIRALAPDLLDEVIRLRAERDALRAREAAALVAEQFGTAAHVAHSIETGVFPEQSDIRDAIAAAIRRLPALEAK